MRRLRCEGGFTLLEAIVALVIASTAISAFSLAMATSYRSAANLDRIVDTLAAARAQIDGLDPSIELQTGSSSGSYRGGMRWQMAVTKLGGTQSDNGQVPVHKAYWIVLEVVDPRGRPVFKLQTGKVGGAIP